MDSQALVRLCNGNQEAMDWLQLCRYYCHEIDDLVDETIPQADKSGGIDRVCRIGALALKLYTHPFFLKHLDALSAVMMLNTINYRDSCHAEASTIPWAQNFSDWARHGGIDVSLVVGEICGGYERTVGESMALRHVAYQLHHDAKGNAT